MAQRFVVEFTAVYPQDVQFNPAGDIVRPAGFELACSFRDILLEKGGDVSPPTQRGYYGWEIAAKTSDASLLLVLQLTKKWLVVVEGRSRSLWGGQRKVEERLTDLRRRIESDERLADMSWQA